MEQPEQAPDTDISRPSVLVVEDEDLFARAVGKRLRQADLECEIAGSLEEARGRLATHRPDLLLLDMRLPDGSGLEFLRELRARQHADLPVVVITAFGGLEDAIAAMKARANDYLVKPIDLDELLVKLEKVLDQVEITRQLEYSRYREQHAREEAELLGTSAAMGVLRAQIERIQELAGRGNQAPPTVLIQGETGTGKDLAARALHMGSARASRPFVHLDCAALPKDLIEAELFGHEKGAFTDAHTARTGLIEAAEDGTVFLDEVGELPLELQSRLLSVIERRHVRRIGSTRQRTVAAWFIAATNRNLQDMVANGIFRSDLYFRLKVLALQIAPLRERREDVALLIRQYCALTARRYGTRAPEVSLELLEAAQAYHWPGNVRELVHMVERAVLLSTDQSLNAAALGLAPAPAPAPAAETRLEGLTLEQAELLLIRKALSDTNGNVSEAARRLGISRMALRYRIQKLGIETSQSRQA
jgi:DNA-binding NtrC family response regulator